MITRGLWTMAVVLALAGPGWGGQGSKLDSSQASAFMGTWVIAMEIPQGAQETVKIWDEDGKVAASVQSGRFPPLTVKDIARAGDSLVLRVERWENGKPKQAVVTLTRDGELMKMTQELEGSRVTQHGSGKRQSGR